MDGEEFFDRLYSRVQVPFPCYAVALAAGRGVATEAADDGTAAVVILTDDDLADRYAERVEAAGPVPVELSTPDRLARLLRRLPPAVTHVTFDPEPRHHRRFPVGVIADCLAPALEKKAG